VKFDRRFGLIFSRIIGCIFTLCVVLGVFASAQEDGQQVSSTVSAAPVPRLIRMQGTVRDESGKPLVGRTAVTFTLYRDENDPNVVWQETQNLQLDSAGRYSALLGATNDAGLPIEIFSAGEARWLSVRPDGHAEQPRILLLSVAYALKAADAETLGGKPASAYVLAGSQYSSPQSTSTFTNAQSASPIPTVSVGAGALLVQPQAACASITSDGTATANHVTKFTTACNIENSAIFESGGNVGIGNTAPAGMLDVSGTTFLEGLLTAEVGAVINPSGTATTAKGFVSSPLYIETSVFNTSLSKPVTYLFDWEAEPTGNDTTNTGATLNLLFGAPGSVSETGLSIGKNGIFTFAPGQTFPGASGTVTNVATGAGLTGGPITTTGTISIPSAGVTNAMLANSSVTVKAGSGLTGGGAVALGGTVTLSSSATGTVTSVATGTGLTGGPITTSGTISIPSGGVTNSLLANPSITVTAGSGLSGGGTVALGGTVTITNSAPSSGGTVTNVASGTGLTGGPITGSGTLSLNTTYTDGRYLQLSGGALTGGLTGTTATFTTGTFTGAVTAAGAVMPTTGTATASKGFNSNPFDFQASSFSSSTSKAVTQDFRWTAEPAGNDSANPSGTLNLLFGSNGTTPAETGLSIASNGLINFASGQTFPGAGGTGTVTSVNTGAGLTGGPITSSGTISIPSAGVTNAMLANNSVTVTAGTGLSGGGTVALGGTVTLTNTVGGTVTNVATGAGLTGGPITNTGTISIPSAGVTNAMLANSSVTVKAGTGLSGGGTVALGGTVTITNSAPSSGGTVTSVGSGTGLTGGPITGSGTLSLNTTFTDGRYLQLTGGILSGALTGTTAAFTGGLAASTGTFSGPVTSAGDVLPQTGTATASQGFNSSPLDVLASSFNSTTSSAVTQDFRWMAEPAANDSSNPSGSLNLLFGSNGTSPAETGFSIASNGLLTFAPGQTFPGGGGGNGTVTTVNTGAGLTGGPITTSGTISIPSAGVTNAMLANSSITVKAGSGLSGGGTVALGGTVTLTNTASGGTVTSVGSGTGLIGGPITTSGSLSLDTSFTDGRYLQLSGGILSGALTGTTAAFTGGLAASTGLFSGSISSAGDLLPQTGTATASQGFNSNPLDLQASSFNSANSSAVTEDFRWMAEPAANDSSSPSGSLNLLFGSNGTSPAETGLSIASNGLITFASGQTFPGNGGGGTVTSVNTGAGLTGGPITSSGTISIPSAGVTNSMLVNPSITIQAGSGLSGGGTVALGGTVTLTNTASGGTVTSVNTGAGLTGGPITGSGTISIPSAGVLNSMLANPFVTIQAGSGLSGGGTVALGGTVTLASNLSGTTNGVAYFSNPTTLTSTPAPTNGQVLVGSTGNAPALATLTAGPNVSITNGPGSITISSTGGGGGSPTLPFFATAGSRNGTTQVTAVNVNKLWGFLLPYNVTTTEITYDITTKDSTANDYDIGIFNSAGTLVLDIGPTAGTTFAPTAAFHTLQWTQGSTALAAGKYYIGLTTNCKTACAVIGATGSYVSFAINASAGASIGGALSATITPPADTWASGNQPVIIIQ
jgi:fibronectin-binding autotransporter adhesin